MLHMLLPVCTSVSSHLRLILASSSPNPHPLATTGSASSLAGLTRLEKCLVGNAKMYILTASLVVANSFLGYWSDIGYDL